WRNLLGNGPVGRIAKHSVITTQEDLDPLEVGQLAESHNDTPQHLGVLKKSLQILPAAFVKSQISPQVLGEVHGAFLGKPCVLDTLHAYRTQDHDAGEKDETEVQTDKNAIEQIRRAPPRSPGEGHQAEGKEMFLDMPARVRPRRIHE